MLRYGTTQAFHGCGIVGQVPMDEPMSKDEV